MSIFFKNRDGNTRVDDSIRSDLILFHINDMTELYECEMENIAEAVAWSRSTNKNHMDYLVWLELHKVMLCDVWNFAGKVRTIQLNNPDFLMPYEVLPELKSLQDNFIFWLKNKTFEEREMIARLHERFLTIHPFKDGNGRWSRLLVNFICLKENLEIPKWGLETLDDEQRRKSYLAAVYKARKEQSFTDLISFMY